MSAFVVALRIALAATFAVASVAKLRGRAAAEATVAAVGVPTRLRGGAAFALSVVELGVAALLVLPGLTVIGAWSAAALLATFLVVLGAQYLRGVEVPCACFGQLAVTPAGLPTLARNAVLLVAVVFVILAR